MTCSDQSCPCSSRRASRTVLESNGAAVRARHLPLAPGLCAHGPPALDGQQHTHRRVLRGVRRDDVGAIFTSSAAGAGSRSDPPLCALGHGGACGRAGSDAIAAALATIPPPPPSSPPPPTPPQQPAKITKSKTEVLFVAALPHTHANPSTYNGADLSYVLLPGAGTSSRSSLSSATSATCLRSVITEKILPTSSSPS